MVTIDEATVSDSPDICHVIRTVFTEYGFSWDPEDYHWDLYNLKEAYFDKGYEFYVARLDGKVVGTVALEVFIPPVPSSESETLLHNKFVRVAGADCSLERLYVLPEARGQRIAQTLTEKVMERAKERGCTSMELWSDKRFTAAHRLYEKLGATVVGERICHDPEQSPEWGLRIRL